MKADKTENSKKIGVIGAGTWGMALARMLVNSGHDVTVWTKHGEKLDTYAAERVYPKLDNMIIPADMKFEKDIAKICVDKDILLFAVPSVNVRETMHSAAPYIKDGQIIVNVAKGIESETLMSMTEVISDEMSKYSKSKGISCMVKTVALSGPTHAEEVAKDLPSMIVSSSEYEDAANLVQDVFMNTSMRVYTNNDKLGIELCGAMKNIIALASGMSAGLGFGDNTKAALITRGLAEITRLGLKMGCERATFSGLAGMGDLIVTCTSMHSRNNRAGMLIGQGRTPKEAADEVGMVVEGINAIPGAMQLAEKYQVEMPLTKAVNKVVNDGADPLKTVQDLMSREKKDERI